MFPNNLRGINANRIVRIPKKKEGSSQYAIRVSSWDKVSDIKEKIMLKCNIPIEDQKKLYRGSSLMKNKDKASRYALKVIFFIFLFPRKCAHPL